MRHSYHLEGGAFRLRPINDDDAGFVVSLRSSDVRTQYLNRIAGSIEGQLEWLRSYYSRENDYYFVIEKIADSSPQGMISVYDVLAGRAEWGRWIIAPGSLAAVESVILMMSFAFEELKLDAVFSKTVEGNASVISFHDGCGFRRHAAKTVGVMIDKVMHDVVTHECTMEEWTKVKMRLIPIASKIAQRVNCS